MNVDCSDVNVEGVGPPVISTEVTDSELDTAVETDVVPLDSKELSLPVDDP